MKEQMRDRNSNSLLADLTDISGLPLDELQFLGKWGLLRTYLAKIPAARYTLEEWCSGLAVLCGRQIRFSSMDEVERWLTGAAREPETHGRP